MGNSLLYRTHIGKKKTTVRVYKLDYIDTHNNDTTITRPIDISFNIKDLSNLEREIDRYLYRHIEDLKFIKIGSLQYCILKV